MTECAVCCADGRVHMGPQYLRSGTDIDVQALITGLDGDADGLPGCGGAPHYLASRSSSWEPVQQAVHP